MTGKILHGDNIELLQTLSDNSVDSCISDFPYAIEFMGKNWDSSKHWNTGEGIHGQFPGTGYSGKRRPAFYANTHSDGLSFYNWCYDRAEILISKMKPGGYVAIFGHPKTNHRMKCAFEDAGFKVVEEIDWVYLCVSEDTTILTKEGWKTHSEISTDDYVMTLNTESDIAEWQKVDDVYKYSYSGPLYHIKTKFTDQLVTPNHRVLCKHKRKQMRNHKLYYYVDDYEYVEAQYLQPKCGVFVPLGAKYPGTTSIGSDLAYLIGFIIGDGMYHKDCSAISIYQTDIKLHLVEKLRCILTKLNIKFSEYQRTRSYASKVSSLSKYLSKKSIANYIKSHGDATYTEHQFYICVEDGKNIRSIIPKNELTMDMLEWDYEDRLQLIYGLIDSDGSYKTTKNGTTSFTFWQTSERNREIFQMLCFSLGFKTSWDDKKLCVGVSQNPYTQIPGSRFSNNCGIKQLPTVEYAGIVWCVSTKNTNFVARRNGKVFITGNSGMPKSQDIGKLFDKQDDYELAEIWNGWKTSGLKPAHEPITVFQKPLDGTYTDNIRQHGCGAMNIDACRVPISKEDIDMINAKASKNPTNNYSQKEGHIYGGFAEDKAVPANEAGRFPPNVLISDDMCEAVDAETGYSTSTGGSGEASRINRGQNVYSAFNADTNKDYINNSLGGYGDSGGGSRMFPVFKYCPKPANDEKILKDGTANPHVTIKPVKLIVWLIKLLTPKQGMTIDITAGSCTHAVACEKLNREENYQLSYIDMELMNSESEPYVDIGKRRVAEYIRSQSRKLF